MPVCGFFGDPLGVTFAPGHANIGSMRRTWLLCLLCVFAVAAAAQFSAGNWRTDTSKRSISLKELRTGGPPKDGIPALNHPRFVSPIDASSWLDAKEPVIVVEIEGQAPRAYPLQILIWHELVNDQIGDNPVLISYCPLCNSGVAFDRRIDGQTLEFGVSGMVRESDMVMYDRQSDSLWQQITGEAIVGAMTGKRLSTVPIQTVPFGVFAQQFPNGRVLDRATGYRKPYGQNPYVGYESSSQTLFPVQTLKHKGVRPFERLLVISIKEKTKAYPFSLLRKLGVVEDEIEGEIFVILFDPASRTVLDDANVSTARSVGAAGVFSRQLGGATLSFHSNEGHFEDLETHSTWDLMGVATSGPMAGKRLSPIEHNNYFAFAWLAFRPNTYVVTDR